MKQFCTGPRYKEESQQMALHEDWHGLYGHFNIVTPDHKSNCTDYGKHDRVCAFMPDHEGLYCRVDTVWGLGMPTPKQILKAAEKQNCQKYGKNWVLDKIEPWDNGESFDVTFKKVK